MPVSPEDQRRHGVGVLAADMIEEGNVRSAVPVHVAGCDGEGAKPLDLRSKIGSVPFGTPPVYVRRDVMTLIVLMVGEDDVHLSVAVEIL